MSILCCSCRLLSFCRTVGQMNCMVWVLIPFFCVEWRCEDATSTTINDHHQQQRQQQRQQQQQRQHRRHSFSIGRGREHHGGLRCLRATTMCACNGVDFGSWRWIADGLAFGWIATTAAPCICAGANKITTARFCIRFCKFFV